MEVNRSRAFHFISDGVVEGENVVKGGKLLGDVASIYANHEAAMKGKDKKVYTVYSYTEGNDQQAGNLYWGLSILYPLDVGGECNMTRGHFHEDLNCAEFYFGIEGQGLLLLMDETGKTWAEKVEPGSLHHIDGRLAHRLVNTGDTVLKVGACWPTTAGHDYAATEKLPFGYRVFKENDQIVFKENQR